jgi:cell division protein FtsI/penicillin-binding protein 2
VKPATQPVVQDLRIRKAHLDEVRRGMEMATANLPGSTAKLLVLEGPAAGIKVAAKTGTAEWGSPASRAAGLTPDHAWMVGYAPADNPTVAFAVFIHSGTFGGQACSPIAKRVLERYFTKYGRGGHAATKKDD